MAEKLHKETIRVASEVRKGGMPTYSATLQVGSWANFCLIARQLAIECPNVHIMLTAAIEQPTRSLYVATITPDDSEVIGIDWLQDSLKCGAGNDIEDEKTQTFSKKGDDVTFEIDAIGLTYKPNSEQFPFKLVDQVSSTGRSHLKKRGVYQEEDEEYEFGFDDI